MKSVVAAAGQLGQAGIPVDAPRYVLPYPQAEAPFGLTEIPPVMEIGQLEALYHSNQMHHPGTRMSALYVK